jgi:hypothetical protein
MLRSLSWREAFEWLSMIHKPRSSIDAAIDRLREASAGNPQHPGPPLLLAAALGLKSARTEANVALRRAVGLCPAFGTLSVLRNWVMRQAGPDFMPVYEHIFERGLRRAGMAKE